MPVNSVKKFHETHVFSATGLLCLKGLFFIKAGLLTYFSHSKIILETVYHAFAIYFRYFSNALMHRFYCFTLLPNQDLVNFKL